MTVIDEAKTFTEEQLSDLAAHKRVVLNDDAALGLFHVGMSVTGPPEAFGLPPDDSPRLPGTGAVVTAVDYENGIVTLAANEWPRPGLYDGGDLAKARFPE